MIFVLEDGPGLMDVQRVIGLMKRSYEKPLIFHRLHCHLTELVGSGGDLTLEMQDEWTKILVCSAGRNKEQNQGLESKILILLKGMRSSLDAKDSRLKLWAILYYMRSRPLDKMNHLIMFELVSHFLGISEFTDGLILSILSLSIVGPIFGLQRNKRLRDDGIIHLLNVVGRRKLGILGRIHALPCYVSHEVSPPVLCDLNAKEDVLTFVALESVCFYAKYTKSVSFVKGIVPDSPMFIEFLEKHISKSFSIEFTGGVDAECLNEDDAEEEEVFEKIKDSYQATRNKERFVKKVIEFVSRLELE